MKYWCKKHKKEIAKDEIERCLKENDYKGCTNLIKKRRRKKTSGSKPLPKTVEGEMSMAKTLDRMEFILYQMGFLPINSKTGEGTILRELIDNQWKLLECLRSAHAKICLILRNGVTIEGTLYRVEQFRNKIRVKVGESNEEHGIGIFMDTWPREVVAVKFKIAKKFNELEFQPYQEKQKSYIDISHSDLNETEHDLFWDSYDLMNYLYHGKYSVDEVRISLINGMEFSGNLDLVRPDRVLLSLSNTEKSQTYLDVHPLMISAVRFEVGSAGWPYDPGNC